MMNLFLARGLELLFLVILRQFWTCFRVRFFVCPGQFQASGYQVKERILILNWPSMRTNCITEGIEEDMIAMKRWARSYKESPIPA